MADLHPSPALSLHLRNFAPEDPGTWEPLLVRARAADRAGIDRLVVSDHVVFGETLDAYADPARGGVAGGTQPTGPDGHWLEPLTVLAVIAGLTSRARLHTAVLLAALRRPAVLAKQLATLDVLCGGRLDIGVGVGWQQAEYEACGLDYHRRGDQLDDTLATLRALWTDRVTSVDNTAARFEGIHAMPKPRQAGGVPLWISGRLNRRVVDRIVRFGSGWIPWGDDARDPAPGVTRLRRALEQAGRSPAALAVSGTLPVVTTASGAVDVEATAAGAVARCAAGITDLRVHLTVPADHDDAVDQLGRLVDAFRAAVGRSGDLAPPAFRAPSDG